MKQQSIMHSFIIQLHLYLFSQSTSGKKKKLRFFKKYITVVVMMMMMMRVMRLMLCHLVVVIVFLMSRTQSKLFPMSSFSSSFSSFPSALIQKAFQQSVCEQSLEDINNYHKYSQSLCRRLIALPLNDAFNPHQGHELYGKLQYSDKCSLPASIGKVLFEKQLEVPWLFEMRKIKTKDKRGADKLEGRGVGQRNLDDVDDEEDEEEKSEADYDDDDNDDDDDDDDTRQLDPSQSLSDAANRKDDGRDNDVEKDVSSTDADTRVGYCSPLDFRSLENYIFMPQWLMRHLSIQANDMIDIRFVRMKLGSLVVLEPLSLAWEQLIKTPGLNPKHLLEHEINKFSSLTLGSTITIEVDNIKYPIRVKRLVADGGMDVKGVRIQDSDVRVDIDRHELDILLKKGRHGP